MDILNIRISVDKCKDRGNYGESSIRIHGVCMYNGGYKQIWELEEKLIQMEVLLIISLAHHLY